MYGMTNPEEIFSDELTEWSPEVVFIQYQCQISIYYKCAPDGTKIVVFDDCVYWYTSESLGK